MSAVGGWSYIITYYKHSESALSHPPPTTQAGYPLHSTTIHTTHFSISVPYLPSRTLLSTPVHFSSTLFLSPNPLPILYLRLFHGFNSRPPDLSMCVDEGKKYSWKLQCEMRISQCMCVFSLGPPQIYNNNKSKKEEKQAWVWGSVQYNSPRPQAKLSLDCYTIHISPWPFRRTWPRPRLYLLGYSL